MSVAGETDLKVLFIFKGQKSAKSPFEGCTELEGAVQVHLDDPADAFPRTCSAGILHVYCCHALLLP